jgi:hypothetical protein
LILILRIQVVTHFFAFFEVVSVIVSVKRRIERSAVLRTAI